MTITSPNSFQDVGFDISHNNGTLDFTALWNSGRRVVWLKITEGTTFKDPMFKTYVQQIIDSGFPWRCAAYHFCHDEDPQGQVDFFLRTFEDTMTLIEGAPQFLFMLDCERGNNPPTEQTVLQLVPEMIAANVSNPMNYGGYDFFSQKWPVLADSCSCFLAEYGSHPISPIPWRRPDSVFGWDWWQYTGDGLGPWVKQINGGSTNMDLSCFNNVKNPQGFESWWDGELAKTEKGTA